MNVTNIPTDICTAILNAAEKRFTTFGFGKTTMAEIAQDVDMSAANLYRYFKNKHEIAAACADRCMSERSEILRQKIRDNNLTAQQRLHVFILGTVQYTHEMAKKKPNINELCDIVTQKNPQLIHEKIAVQCSFIAEILAYGNQTGEFSIDDVVKTAKTVYSALPLFEVPMFVPLYSLTEYEKMAANLAELLISGLIAKR